jgi:hypothetical protein
MLDLDDDAVVDITAPASPNTGILLASVIGIGAVGAVMVVVVVRKRIGWFTFKTR